MLLQKSSIGALSKQIGLYKKMQTFTIFFLQEDKGRTCFTETKAWISTYNTQ